MKTFLAILLLILVAALVSDGARQHNVPPENYGYSPPTREDRQLFGDGEERTLSKAAPHLFTNSK